MDGVDFMPTSCSVLFGDHFKATAAAGPIVFIGWVSDYSAISG